MQIPELTNLPICLKKPAGLWETFRSGFEYEYPHFWCLESQRAKLKFKGFVVHEDFDNLSKKDRNRIANATAKKFILLDDFRAHAKQIFEKRGDIMPELHFGR